MLRGTPACKACDSLMKEQLGAQTSRHAQTALELLMSGMSCVTVPPLGIHPDSPDLEDDLFNIASFCSWCLKEMVCGMGGVFHYWGRVGDMLCESCEQSTSVNDARRNCTS